MNFRSKYHLIKFTFFLVAFFTFTSTQAAKLYFNDIYKATGSSYTIQPSSLNGISSISGSGFKFTSANPADVSFSGNNIAGILTYTNSSNQFISLYGVISRQNKANGRTMAVNFMPTDISYTNVTGEGYILVIPTKESSFSNGDNVGTSSDPIAAVLNDVLDTQNSSPIISVNDVTVNNTDSYAVFTISLSRAANAVTTFTPSLSPVTAALNTDYTNSMEYYNGSTWVNISTTVSIAQNATSIQIRVPILNGGAVSSKTFNLNTGTITGSNVLNSDGAYGIGTILPTPSITFSGTLSAFITCTNIASTAQSFTVSGTYLTSNILIGALTGYEYALSSNGTYSSTLSIAPTNGNITNTAIYVRLSSSATTGAGGNITISSTGATTQNVATGSATINSVQFNSTPVLTVQARNQYLYSITATTTSNNSITYSSTTTLPAWLTLSSSAQTNGQQIGSTISGPGAVTGDLNGNIYVVQNNGTNIYKITPDGTTSVFATKSINSTTYGGALVIGHYLYISYYAGSYGMAQYDLNLSNPTGVNMLPGVSMLSMTYNNGFVYGAGYNTGKIFKITINESSPASSTISDYISSGLSGPFGLSFNQNGELFVAQYAGRNLLKYAANSTSSPTILFTSSYSLTDTKIDNFGNVYVSFWGGNRIRKYIPDFSSYTEVSAPTTTSVWGMSINSNGTLFYGDHSNNKIYTLQTNANLFGNPQTMQVGQWPISLTALEQNCSVNQNFTITVLPNVPMPVTAQSATAVDGTATITFTPPTDNGGANVTSYTVISSPGNYSVTSSGSPVTISGLTNGTSYTFQIYATNSVGNSTIVTTSPVTPQLPPTITTNGTLTAFSACTGVASATQSFTVSAVSLTNNLILTAPTGYEIATSVGGTYSNTVSLTPSSGTVSNTNIYVRLTSSAFNGASGNISAASISATAKTVATGVASVNTSLTASVTISSNATANTSCTGTSVTFTATPVNGGTTPTYQWKINGTNVGTNSATYSSTTLSNNDIVTVVMGSSIANCLSGSPATSNAITMTVNAVPNAPGSITGLTTICLNSNQVYSVAAVSGATAYTWVVTGNISATSSTNNVINITADNTSGSGTIKVLALNACGNSAYSATLSVTVNNTPAPTASFTTSASNVCLSNAGVMFTNTSSVNGNTLSPLTSYSWDFADGSSIITTNNASNTYSTSGSYDAILTITDANACTSSISNRILVDPISVPGTATAAHPTICYGSNTTINLTGNVGNIQWMSSPSGLNNFSNIIGATSNILNTGTLTSSTDYMAVVRSGSCTVATTSRITVTVSDIPSLTLGAVGSLNSISTSFDLPYSNTVGNPYTYNVLATTPNSMPNFVPISNYGLLTSPINIAIPTTASGNYNFNLTLSNALGCSSAVIPFTISVAVQSPSGLSYTTPNVYTVGSTITALNPSSTGGAITSYTISPSLPGGLTIDPTTGIISGTPSVVSSQTSYIVTGANGSGTSTATVVITVNVAAPAGLIYTTPNVYTVGSTITALNPSSTGGAITSYTISPSLPGGLTIDPTTGVISGTPSAVSSQTSYIVTGTNASGTITATVVITVNVAAPASLSYTTPNVYTIGTTITALNPSSTGGAITSYTITPNLPGGLTIDPTTGIISGTPSAVSSQTSYTVSGTNISGTVTATVVITVNGLPPLSLSYTTPNVYTKGTAIASLNPTNTGGALTQYSIAPNLPSGLTINPSSGIISGTPTVASSQTSYVVTGFNAYGNVSTTVVITVNNSVQPPAPPPAFSGRYIQGNPSIPANLNALKPNMPTGVVPVWCTIGTLNCSTIAPTLPTAIGKYVYQVRTYDTANQLYSTTFVNDTIIIAPPAPIVKDSTYVLGILSNPSNVGVQVTGLTGATFNYFYLANPQTGTPSLGSTIGTKRYTVSQTVNSIESDTSGINVTLLDPNSIIHLQKLVDTSVLQSNSTFNYQFRFIVTNLTNTPFNSVVIKDNLQNSVPLSSEFSIVSNSATGNLVSNNTFNGSTDINVTTAASALPPNGRDSAKFVMNLVPRGYNGNLTNIAYVSANTKWGIITMQSSAGSSSNPTIKTPTVYEVKDIYISIPEGFSPNHDGVNDNFVIIKPYNVTLDLEIFNRWGNVVYSNKNYNNDWDGRGTGNFVGQDLIEGGYYYAIKAVDDRGNMKLFKGYIIIQR